MTRQFYGCIFSLQVGKFDVNTKEVKPWEAKSEQYLTEPIFVADPKGTAEDDGRFYLYYLR